MIDRRRDRQLPSHSLFVGTWHLDPSGCAFQLGRTPVKGHSVIRDIGGRIQITNEWLSQRGTTHRLSFFANAGSGPRPLISSSFPVDAVALRLDSSHELVSTAYREGQKVATIMRSLDSAAREMMVLLKVKLPGKDLLLNVYRYHRWSSACEHSPGDVDTTDHTTTVHWLHQDTNQLGD